MGLDEAKIELKYLIRKTWTLPRKRGVGEKNLRKKKLSAAPVRKYIN